MRRTMVAAIAGGVIATTLTGCSEDAAPEPQGSPVEQPPVELAVEQPTPEPVTLGVIATLSSDPGQGADVLVPAEGTQVAAYRLELGGQPVELRVADDRGTEDGARAAVEELVNARVSGIVAATTGDHLLPALDDAAAADTAVLLPYVRSSEGLPDNAWLTGPTAAAVGDALSAAMSDAGLAKPFLVTGDEVTLPGIEAVGRADYAEGDSDAVVTAVKQAVRRNGADSVVIAASAPSQAQLVSRLQGSVTELPLVLSPEALSPDFADQVEDAQGTTSARFVTAGVDAADATTLTSGERADAVASYFSALRMMSDTERLDLFDSVPFAEVATGADTASHDAVVALVTAAVEAGSAAPGEVLAALDGLQVDAGDGVVGAALDFSATEALPAEAVVELNATSQDPGVRPSDGTASLFWFAAPASE